jgi:hypothetical protein
MRLLPLLVFCLVAAGLASCVVPVGPEWTDPPANYPPTIKEANPAVGSLLPRDPDAGGSFTVEVVLADKNTTDDLFVRWIIDYPPPPFDETASRLAYPTTQPGGGGIERPRLRFAPSCNDDHIASGFSSHRLMLAASDRSFASDDPGQTSLDAVPEGNARVEAVWLFELNCP